MTNSAFRRRESSTQGCTISKTGLNNHTVPIEACRIMYNFWRTLTPMCLGIAP